MARLTAGQSTALAPLERDLLAAAATEAAALVSRADDAGQAALREARRQAETIRARARAQGDADAAAQLASARSEARRAARAILLRAERALYDDLVGQARAGVRDRLQDRNRQVALERAVRRRLGAQATVRLDARGGFEAEAPDGRMLDASSDALVRAAMASLDMEQLWSR